MYTKKICVIILTALFLGCGPDQLQNRIDFEQKTESNASKFKFLTWNASTVANTTLAKLTRSELRVCLSGSVSAADLERARAWSEQSIYTWLRTVKVLDDRVTSKLTYTCSNYDLIFQLRQGTGTSFASPSKITIYMSRPYGTWTHELGHALAGLTDTYSGRTAGSCKTGQPESLMCWGAYGPRADHKEHSTLWEDDVLGVHFNYRRLYGNDTQGPMWAMRINHYSPVEAKAPWPGFAAEEKQLQVSFRNDEVEIDASYEATPIDTENRLGSVDL